jgi:hypothetical protein
MRVLSAIVVQLKPALSKTADVQRVRALSALLSERSSVSVAASGDGQQKVAPVVSGQDQAGLPVGSADKSSKVPRPSARGAAKRDDSHQMAEPKDEKMVRYLATIIAKREGIPLDDAMMIAAKEQRQKEAELKFAKKRARKGMYGGKSLSSRKNNRKPKRIVYTTPGNVRLVSGGLPSLGKRK